MIEKPPIGPMPRSIWIEHRIDELRAVIDRTPVGHPSLVPWLEELVEHYQWQAAIKRGEIFEHEERPI